MLRVSGRAVVAAEPDEVHLSLEVTALEPTPDAALADVARRSEELGRILDELSVPHEARSTAGVSVSPEREWEQESYRFRGHRARNMIVLRLPDASKIGRLMNEATTRAGAEVHGPWWRVALDNPARSEACRQAASEALRKAGAYAEALGVRLGAVLEVTEPGLRQEPIGPMAFRQASAMAAAAPEVTVEPGTLDVGAEVVVTFGLEPLSATRP